MDLDQSIAILPDVLTIGSFANASGMSKDLYYQVRKRLGDLASRLPQGVQGPFFNDDFEDVYFTRIV
ncbi:hypothetical protein THIOSC15_2790007 [uncultured Thiomicrorhabdus sp.]